MPYNIRNTFKSNDFSNRKEKVSDIGGKQYDPSIQYEIGDVVSISDEIYVIVEDPTNPGYPPPAGTAPGDPEWGNSEPISSEEIGGMEYDSTKTDYKIGTIVSKNGSIYTALVDKPTDAPDTSGTTEWKDVKGVSTNFDTSLEYSEGEIIYYNGELYYAPTDIPAGGLLPDDPNSDWESVSGEEPTVYTGTFLPTSTQEYPDTTTVPNSSHYWIIDGLTSDYTFTYGDLSGD